jgi:hypothetical protein
MTRAATWLLSAGVLLFIGVLASQGLPAVLATLALAGWGLVLVACFTCCRWRSMPRRSRAVRRRCARRRVARRAARALGGRVGQQPDAGGQIGGPVLMARHLAQRGMPMQDAAAAITVSTTLQTFAQIGFALIGVALLGAQASHISEHALRTSHC